MTWCFAIINRKLSEIFFDDKNDKPRGHCYIDFKDYSKREQKMILSDIKKCVFTYSKGKYRVVTKNVEKMIALIAQRIEQRPSKAKM